MTRRMVAGIPACAALVFALSGQAAARDCSDVLRIEHSAALDFGSVAVPTGGGGIVILSPTGSTASVGRVSPGTDAHPGIIQLCGPANANFLLTLRASRSGAKGAVTAAGAHVVRGLELRGLAGQIRPDFEGQWSGRLDRHGAADIRVGGTLLIPRGKGNETLIAPFEVTVTAVE